MRILRPSPKVGGNSTGGCPGGSPIIGSEDSPPWKPPPVPRSSSRDSPPEGPHIPTNARISSACWITHTGVPWMKIWLEETAMRCACTAPHREIPVIPSARIRAVARIVFTGYPSRFIFHFDAAAARGDSADGALIKPRRKRISPSQFPGGRGYNDFLKGRRSDGAFARGHRCLPRLRPPAAHAFPSARRNRLLCALRPGAGFQQSGFPRPLDGAVGSGPVRLSPRQPGAPDEGLDRRQDVEHHDPGRRPGDVAAGRKGHRPSSSRSSSSSRRPSTSCSCWRYCLPPGGLRRHVGWAPCCAGRSGPACGRWSR